MSPPALRVVRVACGAAALAWLSACASAPSSTAAAAAPVAAANEPLSELAVFDTKLGTGALLTRGKCAYMHYVGAFTDGRAFETSRTPLRNGKTPPPIAFEVGTGAVMPGWDKGVVGMKVGGLRRLLIPFAQAYGAAGRPPAIPPRTDLLFDVELTGIAAPLPSSSNALRDEMARSCPSWTSVSGGR